MTGRVLHVSAGGSVHADGSESAPFPTIGMAAKIAVPGDTVLVHDGIYRESVNPINGGANDLNRIVYEAAPGEHPVIKGSEVVTGWQRTDDSSVWHIVVRNALFGSFNPFDEALAGDWLERPSDWTLSLGQVYLDGKAMFEAPSLADVRKAEPRLTGYGPDWVHQIEPVKRPDETIWQWCATVDKASQTTEIWANFHDIDPNQHLTEINVRPTCFYPECTGVNYLTVRGFEMAQAACNWAPPTGEQKGALGTHWSKGWIIEDNDIHDAYCSAISLGKDGSTGNSESSRFHRKPGYQTQLEVVFRAIGQGWSKETVGGHIVRRNHLHDCGQTGIVGYMGGAFSLIEDNDIHTIGTRREFFGHELGGIKLHAAVDTVIRHNRIHDCVLGTWLDWEAQGTRVTSNIYYDNTRDFMIEVTSGPCLMDNNVFGSEYAMDNVAQGTAFVHNLFIGASRTVNVLNRSTPYHMPHSTSVAGYACVYGGDDRFYQNIFVGGPQVTSATRRGTAYANGAPISEAEYIERVQAQGIGDLEMFEQIPQPMYVRGNAYLRGTDGKPAPCFDREREHYVASEETGNTVPQMRVVEDADGSVWLETDVEKEFFDIPTTIVDTELLGTPRIVTELYENPDGTALAIDHDLLGHARGEHPVAGPVEALEVGKNRIRLA